MRKEKKENPSYPYIIVMKNASSRFVNITGLLLSVGSAAFFIREMLVMNKVVPAYMAGALFIAGFVAWSWYANYRRDRTIYYSKAILVAGLVWTKMPYFEWLVFVFALLALLEYQAKRPPEIGFSHEHVVFNGLIRKRYPWKDIENVILKDDLLTIDFKNNRLYQREIDSGENEAGEEEFNECCRRKLVNAQIQ